MEPYFHAAYTPSLCTRFLYLYLSSCPSVS